MKYLSVGIDEAEHEKLKSVAKHEYRSVNKQAYIIIRDFLKKHEIKAGERINE